MKNEHIHTEIEKTLQSLDSWKRLSTDDFFTTRTLNRLKEQPRSNWDLKPALKIAVAAAVIIINITSVRYVYHSNNSTSSESTDLSSLMSQEYGFTNYEIDAYNFKTE